MPYADLYSDSGYGKDHNNYSNYSNSHQVYRHNKAPTASTKYNRPPPQKEISYSELKVNQL